MITAAALRPRNMSVAIALIVTVPFHEPHEYESAAIDQHRAQNRQLEFPVLLKLSAISIRTITTMDAMASNATTASIALSLSSTNASFARPCGPNSAGGRFLPPAGW